MLEKKSKKETTGTNDNVAQSFYQNIFYNTENGFVIPSIFEVPMYTTIGGTKKYYAQEVKSVFTNLVKPFIEFNFSKNISSFGQKVKIKHDIYRVDWDLYNAVQSGYIKKENESEEISDEEIETIEERDEATGQVKKRTITRSLQKVSNVIKSNKETSNEEAGRKDRISETPTSSDIQAQLDVPIHTIISETTGITSSQYILELEQFTKKLGDYKSELFRDKCQYVIDTKFMFEAYVTSGLTDYKKINEGEIVNEEYYSTANITTKNKTHTINRGGFEGLSFNGGDYFTFFEVPDKPMFEYPTPEGHINTFTPEIFWTNGEGADEYVVQACYNTGDTGFTGTVFTYIVPKTDDYKENSMSQIKGPETEFEASKTIRKYQLPLRSNDCLLYRVGNVKFIKNMFGVKQSVVTFSDNKQICTQKEPIKTHVFVESDSPYMKEIAGLKTPPSIAIEKPTEKYSLSGVVSGSIVTGATVQLIYPNQNYITQPTTATGEFMFEDVNEGVYDLVTTYRGYAGDTRTIVLTADTSVNIELQIKWDNDYDTWGYKALDEIKF